MAEDWENAGFGIYIHWPFCQSKCPYCDFNSHVRQSVDQSRWAAALTKEIEFNASMTPGRRVDSVFFGGGTPSLMHPETVSAVLDAVHKNWTVSPNVEITLEANPTSVEADKFSGFADAGVNRISMGIQALNDPDLRALGRLHTTKEAMQAFDIAKNTFKSVSFDLIYARQSQSLKDWSEELTLALSMAVDHLSLYQLTIEAGTRFGDLYERGKLGTLPNEELSSNMYGITQEICDKFGLPSYEISNHAKPGSECKHNLIYWRYGDYAGIGPGAHGRLTIAGSKIATEAESSPEAWLKTVETTKSATNITENIAAADQFAEYLMMSLRLKEGSNLERLQSLAPERLNIPHLRRLESDGFIELSNRTLKATARGHLLLNTLLGEILNFNH